MAEDLSDTIRDNASQPAEASVDGQSAKQHPLRDQIEADRYLQSSQASRRKGLPFKIFRLSPPGGA
ncbi:MAG: hypothetical protein WDZ31_04690 [Phycisphaeraceae bacterium]